MQEKDKIQIHEWVYKSLEGRITDAESEALSAMLSSDAQVLEYYKTCIEINRGLIKIKPLLRDSLSMNLCLEEMAAYENKAERIPTENSHQRPSKMPVKVEPAVPLAYKPSRVPLYIAVLSTAALLFLVLYVYLNPKPVSQDVAVMTDTMNAVWLNPIHASGKGERLMTGQGPSALKEGIVSLLYDDGVQVTIEAPAEYELLTSTEIALHYGKLFATVSEAGKGFTVRTQNSRIIDLGTEFGVEASSRGETQLHVFKGMTTLIAGLRNTEKALVQVHAGQARQVDVFNADIRSIQLDNQNFARSIDSQAQTVWRGETIINLADTLKGRLTAVHPSGDAGTLLESSTSSNVPLLDQTLAADSLKEPGYFLAVPEIPYINGIFLTNGADGPVALTSDGSVRWDAPAAPVRQKIGFMRFDLTSLQGSRRGAILSLYVSDLVSPDKPVAVYGLLDQTADGWSETQLHYNNAPGFGPAPLGRYAMDPARWQKLGELVFGQAGVAVSTPQQLNLDRFLEQDTNQIVTLAIVAENSDISAEWRITAKEGDPAEAPSLSFPSGTSWVTITTAAGDGADTYLSNDNQYGTVNSSDSHGREGSFRIRNYWKDDIQITPSGSFCYKDAQRQVKTCPFRLEDRPVGTDDNPVIALKSGAGITFDLARMQSRVPEKRPAGLFTAVCGMPQEILREARSLKEGSTPTINVYVLVDGQERFRAADVHPRTAPMQISLRLNPSDRYLTLAVTGAGDHKTPFDWCLFARPRIVFE